MGLRISLITAVDAFSRRAFTSAGLSSSSIAVNSDTTIHCWLSPSFSTAGHRQSSKPTLLLLHGFGTGATWQWSSQVGPLALHFDLIVPDLVFFGGSTTRSPERSEKFQAEAIAALLDALGLTDGVAAVVGTSYGGFVAYHMARMMGEGRVRKVVIASSDLGKREEDDLALMKRAGGAESVVDIMQPTTAANLRRLFRLIYHRPPSFLPDFLLWDFVRNVNNENLKEKIELLKGVTLGNKDWFQLTPLPQETLIIWGEHDNIFPLSKACQLKKNLGENAKLEVLKNTGHVPQIEDPNQFNKVLLSYLLGEN